MGNKQNAEGKRTHQASEPQRRAGRSHRRQEGREAVQTRGGQEVVGLHQGEETAGPREQAVLQARQKDGAHLRQGEDQSLRHGQVPQDPPDFIDDDARHNLNPRSSLSLSLSLPPTFCLSKSRRIRRVPEVGSLGPKYCSSERQNSSTPRRPLMIYDQYF